MTATPSTFPLRVSAGMAALGVILGAFGAHGLEDTFKAVGEKAPQWWDTAVFYHLVHAVALYAVASSIPFRRGPWLCLCLGSAIFSGTLYVMAVTGMTVLGAVTPVGGLLMIVGWVWLAIRP